MEFESYHPGINLLFFLSMFIMIFYFNNPFYVVSSFMGGLIYFLWLNKLKKLKFTVMCFIIPLVYMVFYSAFNHFGVTLLYKNVIDNYITAEAIFYGLSKGIRLSAFLLWAGSFVKVFTTEKVVYLFGMINGKLALFISIIIRNLPRTFMMKKKIKEAQNGIGIFNPFKIISILITWMIDSFIKIPIEMKNKGIGSAKRSNYVVFRFCNRDRLLVIVIFLFICILSFAFIMNQTNILYNPSIIVPNFTFTFAFFLIIYISWCFFPIFLSILYYFHMKNINYVVK